MDIRTQAKEAGIKSWHLKSEDTLRLELNELGDASTSAPVKTPLTLTRIQIQRGEARLGINERNLQDYLNAGWRVINEE